jgi:hypothetical protein
MIVSMLEIVIIEIIEILVNKIMKMSAMIVTANNLSSISLT